jgi:hypothetical protein
MKLTKGMFGHEFASIKCPPFNLACGQMRGGNGKLTHNSGWYNGDGEKLGWGDLSDSDFQSIQAALEPGQRFVVLSEQASFWKFVTHVGMIGSMSTVQPTADAPGRDYIIEHASYIITHNDFYWVDEYSSRTEDTTKLGRITAHRITRETVAVALA